MRNITPYGFAWPEVQEDNFSAIISLHWLIAFSASPHCHWKPAAIEPPPIRRSTANPKVSPVTESVILAWACAEPTNGKLPVAKYLRLLTARACGIITETLRKPGVAASASVNATESFRLSMSEDLFAPRFPWETP